MYINNVSVKFARVILLAVGQSYAAFSYMDTKSTSKDVTNGVNTR